jgi:hypothetical protein
MSRVLRRPMFRGGIADSDGVGITSGLDTPKRGLVDGPGGYAGELSFGERFRMAMEQDNANKKARSDALKSDESYNLDINLGSIYDALNPPTAEILKRLQERQKQEPLMSRLNRFLTQPVPETELTYRTEAEKQAVIDRIAAEEEAKKMSTNEKLKAEITGVGTDTGAVAGRMEQPAKTDLKTVYEDLLPLFTKELGAAEDEFSRQKYLELAKFGLNLLRQPGGPAGGKRDLLGAIAASAEKPLEGYQTILAKEKQAQRLPKALALEAAMKEAEPGSIGKAVKDLKRLGIPENKAIEIATQTGSATKEQTYEGVIRNIQEGLVKNGIVTDDYAARTTAQELLIAERQGVPAAVFEKFSTNPIEGNYYIMKNGQSGRYYQGKLLKPGEKGFTGPLSK